MYLACTGVKQRMSLSNPWQDLMQSTWYICKCGSRYPNNGFWAVTRPLSILNSVCGELAQIVLGVGFVRSLPDWSPILRVVFIAHGVFSKIAASWISRDHSRKSRKTKIKRINIFHIFYNNCILFNNKCKKRYIRVVPSILADIRRLLQISHGICNPDESPSYLQTCNFDMRVAHH